MDKSTRKCPSWRGAHADEMCIVFRNMESFFGRLKVEMYYGEKFRTADEFVHCPEEYIHYRNNERISLKLKGMSPVQYRTHFHTI